MHSSRVEIISGPHAGRTGELIQKISLPQGQGEIYCIYLGNTQVVPCRKGEFREVKTNANSIRP